MTSEDKITAGFENLRVYIDGRFVQVEKRLDTMQLEIHDNTRDIAHLQTSIYWGFAIMAIVVTFVGFMMTLAPSLLEYFKNKKQSVITEERVKSLIDAAVSRALSEKVRG